MSYYLHSIRSQIKEHEAVVTFPMDLEQATFRQRQVLLQHLQTVQEAFNLFCTVSRLSDLSGTNRNYITGTELVLPGFLHPILSP